MNTFWVKYKFRIVGAGIGAFLHFVVLVLAALGTYGYFVMYIVDYPLAIFGDWVSLRERYYVFLFGLGGTMMYAVLGWCLGLFIEKIEIWGK